MQATEQSPNDKRYGGKQPIDRLIRPFQVFAQHRLAGAILLMAATVVALILANSPLAHDYHHLFETHVSFAAGGLTLDKSLHHWINDGLMGVFFFVVGLEIKREILVGQLSSVRKAMLPILAALGGMVVPAAVYALTTRGGPGHMGWGVPMATDIAFALGILALLGSRVPVGLKVFLTALAIVDDIGAILVIAVFYSSSVSLTALLAGGGLVVFSAFANRLGVRSAIFYFIVGTGVWFCFLESGVHATLAAVLMAMTIPARTRLAGGPFLKRLGELSTALEESGLSEHSRMLTHQQEGLLHEIETTLQLKTAPLQRLEHALVPVTSLLILPLFALANAGVSIGGNLSGVWTDPIFLGIVLGLFVGKQIGIAGFSWLAVRLRLAELPPGTTMGQLHAVSVLGGIGFTMSIFIAFLAFDDPASVEAAKLAILVGTALSAVVGYILVRMRFK